MAKRKEKPKKPLTVEGFFEAIFKYTIYALVALAFIWGAKSAFFISTEEIEDAAYARQEYEDGRYTAEVSYKNTCTGTRNYYDVTIDIEGDSLVRVNFDNGGYLSAYKLFVTRGDKGEFLAKDKKGCAEYGIVVGYKELNKY